MGLFTKWEELLITQETAKYLQVIEALKTEGISYKDKSQNIGHDNRRFGGIGGLGESAACGNLYQIFVAKQDLERAKMLLSKK